MGDDIIEDSTLAGYKTSHPLHPYFLLKIQTDGSMPLAAVLEAATSQLIATLSALEGKFRREFSFKNTVSGGTAAMGSMAGCKQTRTTEAESRGVRGGIIWIFRVVYAVCILSQMYIVLVKATCPYKIYKSQCLQNTEAI
jgi:hypothetical protein